MDNTKIPVVRILNGDEEGFADETTGRESIKKYDLVKPVSGRQLDDMLMAQLPPEKVIGTGGNEITGTSMSTASGYARKKPVIVATSSMSDLPMEITRELGISINP